MAKSFFRFLIRFYQRIISPISPGNCRYYPSCSEYALTEFETRHWLPALAASLLRILRCNQLFAGGFDYPKKRFVYREQPLSPYKRFKGPVRYFLLPCGKDHVYVIKILKSSLPQQ
jgi:putative membrane protein insertion efficiency factor